MGNLSSCFENPLPAQREVFVNHFGLKNNEPVQEFKYPNNLVVSSRYTVINFLPKNLFEQLQRVANFYFLCIGLIQLFIDSPVSPVTSILPLIFVLSVTAAKQGYEDYLRHKADNEENNRVYSLLKDKVCVDILSKDIRVGDVIRIEPNQAFPCDLLLLSSSEPEGFCSVTTASLDGETNLKQFFAIEDTKIFTRPNDLHIKLRMTIQCEQPQDDLYKFVGNANVKQTSRDIATRPLDAKNILLRGAVLKNTEYVYGVAVYTGPHTKLALNSKGKATKFSQVERRLNRFLLFFIVTLLCLATFGCVMKHIFNLYETTSKQQNLWYVPEELITAWRVVQDFFGYLVLFNYLIPISLYVTIEMQKFFGSSFFGWDIEMYHVEEDTGVELPAKANTSDLNEELGQVEYLFSDKTGTLTENRMEFKECSVAGVKYTTIADRLYMAPDDPAGIPKPIDNHKLSPEIENFFIVLALCHTVRIDAGDSSSRKTTVLADPRGTIVYQASSPDEKAFVEISRKLGYTFLGTAENCLVIDIQGRQKRYKALQVLEFDSDRKCMTVIVQEVDTGRLRMLTKGAESSMLPKCIRGDKDKAMQHVNDYAVLGLRTLVIAERELTTQEYTRYAELLLEASTAMQEREKQVQRAYAAIETDLTLLGCTGIEDKLQDGVKETIESLRVAGIQVWVLTGDKEETAVNISQSAGHFTSEMTPMRITRQETMESCARKLSDHEELVKQLLAGGGAGPLSVIVDGQSLNFVLEPALSPTFLRLCEQCAAVLCCRCTPIQKSMVVALVKRGIRPEPVTAAVGDGANDVSMILEAHVGLGIYGKEGRQAVRASDYAVARFRFLKRALLFHGHFYYQRISLLVQYFFYKNIVFILAELYFAFFSAFSFVSVYDAFYLMLYNLTLTGLPILVYGIFEQYIPRDSLSKDPILYRTIRRNAHLTWLKFFQWNGIGLYHGLVCFFVAFSVYTTNSIVSADGSGFSHFGFGVLVADTVVLTANFKLIVESYYLNFTTLFGQVMTWFGYLTFILFYCGVLFQFGDWMPMSPNDMYWVWYKIHGSPVNWLIIILTICLVLVPDIVLKAFRDQRMGGLFRPIKVQSVSESHERLQPNGGDIFRARHSRRDSNPQPTDLSIIPDANRGEDNPGFHADDFDGKKSITVDETVPGVAYRAVDSTASYRRSRSNNGSSDVSSTTNHYENQAYNADS